MAKSVRRLAAWVTAGCVTSAGLLGTARILGWIATSDLVTGLSVVVGAVLAVGLATVQMRATEAENDRTRAAEVRRSVEVEAFTNVTAAVVDLTKRLAAIGAGYGVESVTLAADLPNWESQWHDLGRTHMSRWFELYQARNDFVFAIESHEIALVPYHHLRLFIQFRIDDVASSINALAMSLIAQPIDSTTTLETRERTAEKCKAIGDSIQTVLSYLLDYRIEVMNGLLGDLFERRVPARQPLVPDIKTLTELATPSAVGEEDRRRLANAVRGVRESDV